MAANRTFVPAGIAPSAIVRARTGTPMCRATTSTPRSPRTSRSPWLAAVYVAIAFGVLCGAGRALDAAGSTDQATPVYFDVGAKKVVKVTLPRGLFERCRFRFSGGNTPSVPAGWSGTEWWYMSDAQRGQGLRTVFALYYRPKGNDSLETASRAWGAALPATCAERGWDCETPPADWDKGRQKFGTATVPVWKASYQVAHSGLHPKSPMRGSCWLFEAGDSVVVITSVAFDEGDLSAAVFGGLSIEDRPSAPPASVHAQFMDNLVPFTYVTMDAVRPWVANHGADLETCAAGWTLSRDDAIVAHMNLRGDLLYAPPILKDYVEAQRVTYTSTYQEVSEVSDTKASDGRKGLVVSFVEPASDPKPKTWTTHVYFALGDVVWSMTMSTTEADEGRRAEIVKSFRDSMKSFHLWGAEPK